jgi:hypothetical protein
VRELLVWLDIRQQNQDRIIGAFWASELGFCANDKNSLRLFCAY